MERSLPGNLAGRGFHLGPVPGRAHHEHLTVAWLTYCAPWLVITMLSAKCVVCPGWTGSCRVTTSIPL